MIAENNATAGSFRVLHLENAGRTSYRLLGTVWTAFRAGINF